MKPEPNSTVCVHAGTLQEGAAVITPLQAATVYRWPNDYGAQMYPRYFNTPNQRAVCAKLAALEHAEAALVFGSGMAAISTVLLTLLRPGDHLVVQQDVYGGTRQLVDKELPALGIEVSLAQDEAALEAAVRPNTKVIYVESPSNPLLRLMDLQRVAKLARACGALSVIDNTFATPINQLPLDLGIDVVVHSGTKYLNGHSDVNCGLAASTTAIISRVREQALRYGGSLDAHGCWLLERGMKTLALRVERHNENALKLAQFLEKHPAVKRVHYPGLPSHPQHELARRQMRGFGGMLSFELKQGELARAMLGRLRMVAAALSLGGIESLVCIPAQTSHVKMTPEERLSVGISEGLVRVSAGIEHIDDIIADFRQAIDG